MNTQLNLTPFDKQRLQRTCSARFNWSDGGHWIGSGRKPNCFVTDRQRSKRSHTYHFPTDESATKWNLECEKVIRLGGHIATAALTAGVTILTSGFAGFAAGTIAAVTKDELQAKVPYPRVARGWSFEIVFEYEFFWSPHPMMPRTLSQKITTAIKDHENKERLRNNVLRKFNLADLPDGIARALAMEPSRSTKSNY